MPIYYLAPPNRIHFHLPPNTPHLPHLHCSFCHDIFRALRGDVRLILWPFAPFDCLSVSYVLQYILVQIFCTSGFSGARPADVFRCALDKGKKTNPQHDGTNSQYSSLRQQFPYEYIVGNLNGLFVVLLCEIVRKRTIEPSDFHDLPVSVYRKQFSRRRR